MKTILVLALFVSQPSFAHIWGDCCQESPEKPKGQVEFIATEVDADGGLSGDTIQNLFKEAHDLEHNGPKIYWRYLNWWNRGIYLISELAKKFDPEEIRNLILNKRRWFFAHRQDPEMANASANIVAMLLTSHAIETVGGLTAASLGSQADSEIVKGTISTLGIAITLPGLDPLCYLLGFAYLRFPKKMNQLLTWPRLFVLSARAAAMSVAGAPVPIWYLNARADEFVRRQFIQSIKSKLGEGRVEVHELSDQQAYFRVFDGRDEYVDLEFQYDSVAGMSLRSLELSSRQLNSEQLLKNLSPFGGNIRHLVNDLIYQYPTSASFIETNSLDEETDRRFVRVKRGAFPFHAMTEAECEVLMEGV